MLRGDLNGLVQVPFQSIGKSQVTLRRHSQGSLGVICRDRGSILIAGNWEHKRYKIYF